MRWRDLWQYIEGFIQGLAIALGSMTAGALLWYLLTYSH